MLTPKAAADNAFLYQKVFGDGEFIASGQLIIPVGGRKPSKGTKDNTYVSNIVHPSYANHVYGFAIIGILHN